MLWGAKLLNYVGFPTSEVLGPETTSEQIKDLIDRYGSVLIKPNFKGGVGKKGKAGLIRQARDVATAMREKERLYFVEHRFGNTTAKAEGVTFESAIPAKYEIYASISDNTRYRAPDPDPQPSRGYGYQAEYRAATFSLPVQGRTGVSLFTIH
jgi:succinyl-CoA synthetase beta subunit